VTLARLAITDIRRNEFRSWMVFLSTVLVAGLVLASALVLRGTTDSLRLTRDRLGADVLVVPRGSEDAVGSALLMGATTSVWMPVDVVSAVRSVRGVAAASPQMYLATLTGASCCSASDMLVVAFDPATDFTVRPWLEETIGTGLERGEAVGGAFVSVPDDGEGLRVYGQQLQLVSNLERTGGNLDRTLFITFDTAEEVARRSVTEAESPLKIPGGQVSSVLVRVEDGTDPAAVAAAIMVAMPDVTAIVSPEMFGAFRDQMGTLRTGLSLLLALTLALSVALIAVVFSVVTHERRREIGVWRALGATRRHVVRYFVVQATVLAAAGGLAGAAFSALAVFLFHDYLVGRLGTPFLLPSVPTLALFMVAGVAAAVVTAALASLAPAVRIVGEDPASAMRE
jgi:putative ABC transport system permease protein